MDARVGYSGEVRQCVQLQEKPQNPYNPEIPELWRRARVVDDDFQNLPDHCDDFGNVL